LNQRARCKHPLSVDPAFNPGHLFVIFDGHCGLCNALVRWLLRRDKLDRLRFAASESEKVAGFLGRHGFAVLDPATGPGTILVVRDTGCPEEHLLVRSDAVVAVLHELPQPWPVAATILKLIPRPLRDLGYRLIARWRYRIWGRLESCPVPTTQERERFL
jgi:predicted DCC family thiol-disulfide oxidoreductase YuxK